MASTVDVADRDQMLAFAAAVHEHVEAVDLLVNNAGVGLGATFLETPLEDWDWILPINVMGVVHGCHIFVPAMVKRGSGGHVVNLSSAAGYFANPSLAAYSATKFAVRGLSEALRTELRPAGIGVTAVCPGLINTPITRNSRLRGNAVGQRERVVKLYERRNYGPDRVAQRILHAVQHDRAVMPVSAEAWLNVVARRGSPRSLPRPGPRDRSCVKPLEQERFVEAVAEGGDDALDAVRLGQRSLAPRARLAGERPDQVEHRLAPEVLGVLAAGLEQPLEQLHRGDAPLGHGIDQAGPHPVPGGQEAVLVKDLGGPDQVLVDVALGPTPGSASRPSRESSTNGGACSSPDFRPQG